MSRWKGSFIQKLSHLAHSYKHARFGKLEKLGLYHGQPRILAHLCREDGLNQKDLAGRAGITTATLSRMVQRMEKTGVLERRADEKDQRAARVFITDKGRDVMKELDKVNKEMEQVILGDFTPEEKDQFVSYLERVTRKIEEIKG